MIDLYAIKGLSVCFMAKYISCYCLNMITFITDAELISA